MAARAGFRVTSRANALDEDHHSQDDSVRVFCRILAFQVLRTRVVTFRISCFDERTRVLRTQIRMSTRLNDTAGASCTRNRRGKL